jgi:hypothetical protein
MVTIMKETREMAEEMKKELKFPFKTASQCLREALRRLAKARPIDEKRKTHVKRGDMYVEIELGIAKLTVKEILEQDNIIRTEVPKCFGLRPLREYPVVQDEYNPATKKATWKKLIGGEVIMEPGKLPVARAIWQESEGFDPAENMDILETEVTEECKKLYPTTEATKEERKAVMNSLIQRRNLELAKDIDTGPLPYPEGQDANSEEPGMEPIKKGRPPKLK